MKMGGAARQTFQQQYRLFSVSMAKDPYDNIPESITELTTRKIYK
jgi:phenylalanyl-tRNA synthetase alpha chain